MFELECKLQRKLSLRELFRVLEFRVSEFGPLVHDGVSRGDPVQRGAFTYFID